MNQSQGDPVEKEKKMGRRWDTEVGQISFYMLDLAQYALRELRESENIHSYCTMSGTVPCVCFYKVFNL